MLCHCIHQFLHFIHQSVSEHPRGVCSVPGPLLDTGSLARGITQGQFRRLPKSGGGPLTNHSLPTVVMAVLEEA